MHMIMFHPFSDPGRLSAKECLRDLAWSWCPGRLPLIGFICRSWCLLVAIGQRPECDRIAPGARDAGICLSWPNSQATRVGLLQLGSNAISLPSGSASWLPAHVRWAWSPWILANGWQCAGKCTSCEDGLFWQCSCTCLGERTSPRGVDECSGFVCPFLLWLGVGELPRVNPSQVALPGGTLQRWGDLLHQWASTCYQECSRGIEVACPADFLWQILYLYSTTLWAWCATSKLDGCGLTVGDLAAHLYNQINQTKYNIIYIYIHIYIYKNIIIYKL